VLRVFPIATTSAESVPGFSSEWNGKSNVISADEGAPIVSVDEGHVYNDALTRTVRLHAFDGATYDYGKLDGVRDGQVHVGEIIGYVSEARTVTFAVYPPMSTTPVDPYPMLAAAPNLFIPRAPVWKSAAKMAALAAAGLGVGAVLAAVYYRTVRGTDERRPQLPASPVPKANPARVRKRRVRKRLAQPAVGSSSSAVHRLGDRDITRASPALQSGAASPSSSV